MSDDINNDGYTRVRYLPSRFVPYIDTADNSVPELFIRKMKLGEVDYLFANKGHSSDILTYMAKREIVKGIPLERITVDDWAFLELTITAMTFTSTKFNIDGGECPECGDEIKYVEYELPDGKIKRVEVRGEMKAIIIPSQVSFQELDETVEPPVELELVSKTVEMDFFRLKHFIAMEKQGFFTPTDEHDPQWADKERIRRDALERVRNEMITGVSYEDLDIGDNLVINYAVEKMAHPVQTEFPIKCTKCGHQNTIRTSWEVMSFVPFRTDERSARDRIHFGKRDAPANNEPPKPRLSSRPMALRQGGRGAETKG